MMLENSVEESYYAKDKESSVAYITEVDVWVAWVTHGRDVYYICFETQDKAYIGLYIMENIIGWEINGRNGKHSS